MNEEDLKNHETIKVNCPLCNSSDHNIIAREFNKTQISKCKNCDLIYTSIRIKEPEKFYFGDENYYVEESKLVFEGKAVSHRWPNYLHDVALLKKFKQSGKLLDIGSNLGFFAKLARENGYDVYCIEPSKSLAKIAKKYFKLNVFSGFLEDFKSNEKFDIITLSDVFEHITYPQDFLRQCRKLLKDDGIIFIKVPHAKFSLLKELIFRPFNKNKDIWDSYEHVVHYTQDTMTKMLNKCGFNSLCFFVDPPVQLPNWHEYVGKYYQYPTPWFMDIKKKFVRKLFYHVSRLFFVLTGSLPSTSQAMAVVANKKELNAQLLK